MPADETEIHVHEGDVSNIVHKEEKLSLSLGRLRDHLVHPLKRRHAWSVIGKAEHDVLAKIFGGLSSTAWAQTISHQFEKYGRVGVRKIEGGKHNEGAIC